VIWLWASALLMAVTALTHSIRGEARLIGPLLRLREGVLASDFARTIVRFGWHVTSVLMVASAITMVWPGTPDALIGVIGALWIFMGLVSLIGTRGKHVGWPLLSAAGVFALVGACV